MQHAPLRRPLAAVGLSQRRNSFRPRYISSPSSSAPMGQPTKTKLCLGLHHFISSAPY